MADARRTAEDVDAPLVRPAVHDCWNRIGVRGDRSCPLLAQHTHCRNCPAFAAAAAELLNGALPADHLRDWTAHFARPEAVEQAGTQSVMIFRIGSEWLGLPTVLFWEITEQRRIHSLPHRRSGAVIGVVSVRGELLICVALDRVLGIDRAGGRRPDKLRVLEQRMIVVSREGQRLVVPVDEVHGTHRYHPSELIPTPETVAKASVTYTKAMLPWPKGSVGLLDEQLLFYSLNRSVG
jgi:chemotaxis-related protein WspD